MKKRAILSLDNTPFRFLVVFITAFFLASDPVLASPAKDYLVRIGEYLGLLEKDPQKAFDQAQAMPPGQERDSAISEALTAYCVKDPLKSAGLTLSLPAGKLRDDALYNVAIIWAQKDLKAASAWTGQQTEVDIKDTMQRGIVTGLSRQDPRAALDLNNTLSPGARQPEGYVLADFARKNPRAAAELASTLPEDPGKQYAYVVIAAEWSVQDFTAAKKWADQQSDPHLKQSILEQLVTGLGQQDPKGALELAQSMTPGKEKDRALDSAIQLYAAKYPGELIPAVESMPDGYKKDNALREIAFHWAWKDLKGAVAWAEKQKDPRLKAIIQRSIVEGAVNKDPKEAIELAQTMLSGTEKDDFLAGQVFTFFAQKDPVAAAKYVESMPAGGMRDRALHAVFEFWFMKDSTAATQWINNSALSKAEKEKLLQPGKK